MIDQLLQTLGDEISKFLDSPIVRLALEGIAFYFVLLWAATAYWAYRDLQTAHHEPGRAVPRGGPDHHLHPDLLRLRL